ncbi:hypothetical protein Smp_044950 [Schistosoma mansoni]|uniref:IRS-type PTB domain-containing protein n=1 Tax=Schistosoma mansoni TaxID=6183 RepID=G4VRR5_SCHMA|nr:hypothetical protein Smp_044950 [Schistosoma mansoni]|eukprot:XP_018655339.1 hypothetical protein Smp_044950 [Schistosoma mansoni]
MGLINSVNKSDDLQCLFDEYKTRIKAKAHLPSNPSKPLIQFLQSVSESMFNKRKSMCFSVSLLDHDFKEIRQGLITVRVYDIKFQYVHNNQTVVLLWPLHGLRWYGRNKSLFLFQSGSRCKLGPALFIFKCKHPKRLVSCIEKRINSLLHLYRNMTSVIKYLHPVRESCLDRKETYSSSRSELEIRSIGFSNSLNKENEEKSHSIESLRSPSSVVFICGPDDYLLPRNISEQNTLNFDPVTEMPDSRVELSTIRQIYLDLPNGNYLEAALAPNLPLISDTQNNNNSEHGRYVVIALSPHFNSPSTDLVINSHPRFKKCPNNIYFPEPM